MERQGAAPFDGDTSREALRVQFAALRRIPATKRLALMDDLTLLVQSVARAGLKRRHPNASENEIEVLYMRLVLGEELASRVLEHRRIHGDATRPNSASPTCSIGRVAR